MSGHLSVRLTHHDPGSNVRVEVGDDGAVWLWLAMADDVWVEVRAPGAVAEPVTERVNVLDAIRDRIELTHPEGEFLAIGVQQINETLVAFELEEPWGKTQPVAPDGTVEVLREDGDA